MLTVYTNEALAKKLNITADNEQQYNETTFLQLLAQRAQLPYINLADYTIDDNLAKLLPENYARNYQAILLADENEYYLVGMTDPLDIIATDELQAILDKQLRLALVGERELLCALDKLYRHASEITNFADELVLELSNLSTDRLVDRAKPSHPVVLKMLNAIFTDALQAGASDIHIEPAKDVLRIRLRVDGLLQEQVIPLRGNNGITLAIAQSLKLMAGLNIAEKRLPQDGRFETNINNAMVGIRLSTMPNRYGETIVMRILNKSNAILNLDNIGMPQSMLKRFRQLIKSPHGIILVTGPTGSGKTTTIYGALAEINDVTKNIITIEDPIEYDLERLNQVQVNTQINLTFSTVLRAILRQDPNIILVGEIRDQETASIALRAALTGQLVFATLHTNDAASTALRLIDIGVESYLVASTVRAILAQRLVRRICTHCLTTYKLNEQELAICAALFGDNISDHNFKYGPGCTYCNFTGYKGRVGVFELLELNGAMREALRINKSADFIQTVAKTRTSPDLIAGAFQLACQGLITLNEVLCIAGEQF